MFGNQHTEKEAEKDKKGCQCPQGMHLMKEQGSKSGKDANRRKPPYHSHQGE